MNYLAKENPEPIVFKNEAITLPNSFYIWIFDCHDGANYDDCNRNAEYGISRDDFINQYYAQALDDGRNYIIENIEDLPNLIKNWKQSIQNKINMLQKELEFNLLIT